MMGLPVNMKLCYLFLIFTYVYVTITEVAVMPFLCDPAHASVLPSVVSDDRGSSSEQT